MESITFEIWGAMGPEQLTLKHGESKEFCCHRTDPKGDIYGNHWISFGLDNRILWTFVETLILSDEVQQFKGSYEAIVDQNFNPSFPDWLPRVKPWLERIGKH